VQYWICVTAIDNWERIENENVWAVGERGIKKIKKVLPADKLVFYLKNPVKAIAGIYEASSSMYIERRTPMWKGQLYPYRIKIRPLKRVIIERELPDRKILLGLSEIIGLMTSLHTLAALQGKSMIQITGAEFRIINSLLSRKTKETARKAA